MHCRIYPSKFKDYQNTKQTHYLMNGKEVESEV